MKIACLALFFIFSFSIAFASSVPAEGGNVTPLVLNFTSASSRWVVFFGNSTSTLGSQSLAIPNPDVESGRLISLIATNSYYWVSDSPSPIFTLSPANLSALDAKYGLAGGESSGELFNETYNFTLLEPYGQGGALWAEGSAVFFEGVNSSGSPVPDAYRQGVFQSGSDFLFIVPLYNASLGNGTSYQYVFALPYDTSGSSQVFYLYSTLSNATLPPPPVDTGGGALKPVPFRWSYDEGGLAIFTVPHALILIQNAQHRAINDNADIYGKALFRLLPGTYRATIIASGYLEANVEITLVPITATLPSPPLASPEIDFSANGTVQRVCFEGECYVRTGGSLTPLDEISCSGGLCKFIGDDFIEFVTRNDFQKEPTIDARDTSGRPSQFAGVPEFMSSVGSELSSFVRSGGAGRSNGPYIAVFMIVIFVSLASVYVWRSGLPKHRGGHD